MLYIIRHAESQANAKGIYQGQTYDTSLTAKGRLQARKTGKALERYDIKSIIYSPLRRCMQTAQIFEYSNNRIIKQNKLLTEINHGTWEGKTIDQFNQEESEVLKIWQNNPQNAQMINGESFSQVVRRCQRFLTKIKKIPGNNLVVTHDTICRIVMLLISGESFNSFWTITLDNCGITTIDLEKCQLISINETRHLNGIRSEIQYQAL